MSIYARYAEQIKAIPSFSRQDIEKKVFEGFEDFVGTKAQINERELELRKLVTVDYNNANRQRAEQINAILEQYKKELFETEGFKGRDKVNDIIYHQAYEAAHSYGYTEVENHFIQLVDMVRTIEEIK